MSKGTATRPQETDDSEPEIDVLFHIQEQPGTFLGKLNISQINSDTITVDALFHFDADFFGLTYDCGGYLYTMESNGGIYRISEDGSVTPFITRFHNVSSDTFTLRTLAYDFINGRFYDTITFIENGTRILDTFFVDDDDNLVESQAIITDPNGLCPGIIDDLEFIGIESDGCIHFFISCSGDSSLNELAYQPLSNNATIAGIDGGSLNVSANIVTRGIIPTRFDGEDLHFCQPPERDEDCIITESPTSDPTLEPTIPTAAPTLNPTYEPTTEPTVEPTVGPTLNPTIDPTVYPTRYPTKKPTPRPTDELKYLEYGERLINDDDEGRVDGYAHDSHMSDDYDSKHQQVQFNLYH